MKYHLEKPVKQTEAGEKFKKDQSHKYVDEGNAIPATEDLLAEDGMQPM